MKQVILKFHNNEVRLHNNPVYINTGDDVEFLLSTTTDNKLYYSTLDENVEIIDNKFVLTYEQLKILDKLSIISKNNLEAYPQIYPVVGLKIHDITVLGSPLNEKYPDVIKGLYDEIKSLKKALIGLYDRLDEKEKEGVIE